MNSMKLMRSVIGAALVLGLLTLAAGPSLGADVTVDLKAEARSVTLPDGAGGTVAVPMWGFFYADDNGTEWTPGPTLRLNEGDNLTINLVNGLPVPETVSIVIPGQAATLAPVTFTDGQGRSRVSSFTDETASYTWNNLQAGTYLYHSGSHPALQVPMGLYGALIVLPATPGSAYTGTASNPNTAFDSEVVLLYSEIDPVLHDPPAVPTPLDYIPAYYLINGKPYEIGDAPFAAGNINQNVLIRFLNAGLKTHVPTVLNAPYMSVIAEDGNLYPYAKQQYSVLLSAGKTLDAIWSPTSEGTYPLVDRTNSLTTAGVTGGGMLAYLQVGTATGAPVAADDSITVAEGGTVTVLDTTQTSVLFNDTGENTLEAILVGNASNGSLTLEPSGTFSYTHNGGQTSTDNFTYKARDTVTLLESNVATVSITVTPVNNPPVANSDSYNATSGVELTVAAPGVLGNDSDPDGPALTAVLDTDVSGGALVLNPEGSFTYSANSGTTSDSFTYHASDGALSSGTVTVTITVSAPVNTAPVAVDDSATTVRNTSVFINLVANDTDAENNFKDAFGNVPAGQISIVTQPTRGGTVSVLTNGVNFTPKNNFRGTDVFTYTVTDTGTPALTSNTATVRVNVTK